MSVAPALSEKQLEQRRRNVAAIALKRRQATHCQNGHEFTVENTIQRRDGCRQCRTCKNDSWVRFYYLERARLARSGRC